MHFRFDLLTWRELGFRAAAVNISDLAASGAEPLALIVSLGLPGTTELADVVELYEGLRETGVPVRGGDTTRADSVLLSVTALGRADRVPGRAGARPGDLLVVTGRLGAAGAAFRNGQLCRPPVRIAEGRRLAQVATAMLDISDGLAVDAAHIAARSGCRLAIDLERVPLAAGATLDDVGFGEDYELLAATPAALDFAVIGRCEEGSGVGLTLRGEAVELAGWEHFRKPALEVATRARADDGSARLARGEERDGRNRQHLVARGDLGMLVDVELREGDASVACCDELLEHPLDGAARLAPRRPEVDDDRAAADRLVERGRVELAHDQNRPSSAASRSAGTLVTASRKIVRLIFDWPAVRSTNVIGTSTTVKPARSVRYVPSIWNA